METIPQPAATPGAATPPLPAATAPAAPARRWRLPAALPLARHAGFLVVVGFSAILNTHRLSQNGYANVFYSAGVKSMLASLHNFFFVSFDPGGMIAVDKPPLGLWVQGLSAKLFGFSPLSLLLPEAIMGVVAVAALYIILARRYGPIAAFAGSFTLAVFPSFVAVSRDNGVDPLLILLMLLACGAGIRACETGRSRWLIASAVLVGLAFNTKTLAAVLVIPGIALGFLVCAPGPARSRALKLLGAGAAMAVVAFAWIAVVELTPAAKRPYVGGSTNNTELGLTLEYNGFGRVEGQSGGPGQVTAKPGARVPGHRLPPARTAAERALVAAHDRRRAAAARLAQATFLPDGRFKNAVPFGSAPSPVRLFGKGLGDQAGWMVPFALFGLIALAVLALLAWRRAGVGTAGGDDDDDEDGGAPAATVGADGREAWRRDPRLAALFALGGWFLVETTVLSLSKGIVHPYYVSALGPPTAAMAGAGAVGLLALRRRGPRWGVALSALAIAGTVAVQIVLLEREEYLLWLVPVLVGAAAVSIAAIAISRAATGPALAVMFALLLVAPTAYSTTTWLAPVEGTFPAAGPKSAAGEGGYGVSARTVAVDRAMIDYVASHRPGRGWALLTVASDTAAPFILFGHDVAALGGYSGTDPALNGRQLAALVRAGRARWVVLGGEYSTRGGNVATRAVLDACRLLQSSEWHSPDLYPGGLALFDCAGRAAALEAHG
jgi:4-amino-4-deoxy-L-arabinose transferase-like glycosyltransferase